MSTTYTLGSNSLVHSPGIVRWAINGARTRRDLPMLINVISSTWSIPASAARALLLREVPFQIVNEDAVQFTFPASATIVVSK